MVWFFAGRSKMMHFRFWLVAAALVGTSTANADGDLIQFTACLAGPGLVVSSSCQCLFDDGDGDIDLADFAALQSDPPGGLGENMGFTLGIQFDPSDLVESLLIEVLDSWLTDPSISLDIEITGINGGFAFHGAQLVDVVDTTVFFTNGEIAQTIIDWTQDATPMNVNEIYTVCVQPLRCGEMVGPEKCPDFGPF